MWKEYDGTEADAMEDEVYYEEREELRQLIVHRETELVVKDRYIACQNAAVGDTIQCPSCGKKMKKKSYQHAFCSNKGSGNCKDTYWNYTQPERMERVR